MNSLIVSNASAPGKLILFGEHAVVYGHTAIAGCLSDLRVHSRAALNNSQCVSVQFPSLVPGEHSHLSSWPFSDIREKFSDILTGDFGGFDTIKPTSEIGALLEDCVSNCEPFMRKAMMPALFLIISIFKKFIFSSSKDSAFNGIHAEITMSTLPVAAGLGSSAAVSVSLAAVLLDVYTQLEKNCRLFEVDDEDSKLSSPSIKKVPNKILNIINEWAYCSEMLFHGSPSGLDNTVSSFGGAITYSRDPVTTIKKFSPIENMSPLRILIINTKVPKETSKLVAGVREFFHLFPDVIGPILSAIHGISLEGRNLLRSTDVEDHDRFSKIGKLIRLNHSLLNAIGVGHPALDDIVAFGRKYNCEAKLTGAGGGGCGFIILPEDEESANVIVESLRPEVTARGWDMFLTKFGGDGLLFD